MSELDCRLLGLLCHQHGQETAWLAAPVETEGIAALQLALAQLDPALQLVHRAQSWAQVLGTGPLGWAQGLQPQPQRPCQADQATQEVEVLESPLLSELVLSSGTGSSSPCNKALLGPCCTQGGTVLDLSMVHALSRDCACQVSPKWRPKRSRQASESQQEQVHSRRIRARTIARLCLRGATGISYGAWDTNRRKLCRSERAGASMHVLSRDCGCVEQQASPVVPRTPTVGNCAGVNGLAHPCTYYRAIVAA